MKRLLALVLSAVLVTGGVVSRPTAAQACPGCKEALASQNEESLADPETLGWNPAYAYSYSVLFMLAVPAGILITFGTAAYRLTRKPPQQPPDASDGNDHSF
jgi:heme A synthase